MVTFPMILNDANLVKSLLFYVLRTPSILRMDKVWMIDERLPDRRGQGHVTHF